MHAVVITLNGKNLPPLGVGDGTLTLTKSLTVSHVGDSVLIQHTAFHLKTNMSHTHSVSE